MDARLHLDAFVTAARAHGAATQEGDDEAANKQHDALIAALQSLRASAVDWPEILQDALSDADPHVRGWAATHLLAVGPEPATSTLEELASQKGIAAFNARMVLREWRAGRLQVSCAPCACVWRRWLTKEAAPALANRSLGRRGPLR